MIDLFILEIDNFDLTISFILPVLFVIITAIIWFKSGKDEESVEVIEFYPPKNLNSAEVAYIYKGYLDNKDVISLIVYLADKGYIKINQTNKKEFSITKVKSYNGDDQVLAAFMHGIFLYKQTVTKDDLYNFKAIIRNIKHLMASQMKKKKIFENYSSGKYLLIFLMMAIISMLTIGKGIFTYNSYIFFQMIFGIILIIVIGLRTKNFVLILLLIFYAYIFSPTIISIVKNSINTQPIYLLLYLVGIISIVLLFVFIKIMPKRTKYGNLLLAKIKGFKNFLEVAKKDELERLVKDSPSYYYNILPFAYVLDVSDVWIKEFESFSSITPSWLSGSNIFDYDSFSSFVITNNPNKFSFSKKR